MNKAEAYSKINSEFQAIVSGGIPWESALVSLIALLKQHLPYISWVGFYRARGTDLWVGPYQGKIACLYIGPGRGVCGKAFQENRILIVPDVEKFPDHIACDASSRSEIVLPVVRGSELVGVLDLDSHEYGAFDEIDSTELQSLLTVLSVQPS